VRGASVVETQPTQEQHTMMMADFNDTTEHAREALAAAESVDVEARSTGGVVPFESATPLAT
jgi:hypothetical protein